MLALDGSTLEIDSVRVYGEDLTAYNLEIAGIHTYYAGATPVLVHNSCGESWANPATLERHYANHGSDFGASSAAEYSDMASQFFVRAGTEKLPTKIDANGVIRIFDAQSNTFGAFAPNGGAKTLFMPSSPGYWGRQPGVLQ